MKLLVVLVLSLFAGINGSTNTTAKMVCYYDSGSFIREGLGQLLNPDLEFALRYCTHLVYGYCGIKPDTYQAFSLHEDLDIYQHQFSEVTALKKKYPYLKVLLSIGGDKDLDPEHPNKYLELLEGERTRQTDFINSAYSLVRSYGFDGIDLAYQFPKNKPGKVHSSVEEKLLKKIKKLFTGDFVVDPKAEEHKEQFTALVRDLKTTLHPDGYLLSLTVLPNVNSSLYFDVPAVSDFADLINIAAFDFLTPERNPEEADYTAPLFELYDQKRFSHNNADFQVAYWLDNDCPPRKLILGMATYGRAWKLSSDSNASGGAPVVPKTKGAADAGLLTGTPGLLSWPEICAKLPNPSNTFLKGADAPLTRVGDPSKRYGTYAFRLADSHGNHGIWVSYEDPETAANKAGYVHTKGLGGLSMFDLSYDDFQGLCKGGKYPLLKAAKNRL
ncbi:chitinase-like protein Idgf2 [Musca vetustissima]|uniref:chitinase-like protein Idgf2 n=1 Tax=Musca vetustissima TaxID=27455 RepID=UPI002AB67834|nr:chitinase-like protein Idgf2 [Musca vetustissima]